MLKRSMLTAIMAILGLLVSGPGLAQTADGVPPDAFGTLPVMAEKTQELYKHLLSKEI